MPCPACGLPLEIAPNLETVLKDVAKVLEEIDPAMIPPRQRKLFWEVRTATKGIVNEMRRGSQRKATS